jgi:hypothetical protein
VFQVHYVRDNFTSSLAFEVMKNIKEDVGESCSINGKSAFFPLFILLALVYLRRHDRMLFFTLPIFCFINCFIIANNSYATSIIIVNIIIFMQ